MIRLTPEQKAYKEKTLQHLLTSFSLLESKLEKERRLDVADDIRSQLEAIQAHTNHLQQELETDTPGEPVADALYRRIATALTNERFYLAKKLINKLETIEPFYPEIDRLRVDAETGRASRRIQAIAKGGALPEIVLAPDLAEQPTAVEQAGPIPEVVAADVPPAPEKRNLFARLFQFHIIVSCLVVMVIACVMLGVGGITLLEWLIEGG